MSPSRGEPNDDGVDDHRAPAKEDPRVECVREGGKPAASPGGRSPRLKKEYRSGEKR